MPYSFSVHSRYVIRKSGWSGRRFLVKDEDGQDLYEIKSYGFNGIGFFAPGSVEPRFHLKPRSFWSSEVLFVETSVDYAFASVKPVGANRGDWELLDVSGVAIGRFQAGFTKEAIDEVTSELRAKKGLFAVAGALKDTMGKLQEMARFRELVVENRPVVRFEMQKDGKAVTAQVLDLHARRIEERIVVALAFRCLVMRSSRGDGG